MTARDSRRPIAAIVGSGNIGTDLAMKLNRSRSLELRYLVGIDPDSPGLAKAAALGLETSSGGVDWLLQQPEPPAIVFEATSAAAHAANAPRYLSENIRAVDLTPAGIGPPVVPTVNLEEFVNSPNVSLLSCGAQATIPIVAAVNRVVAVSSAEIVASIASASAGPGTRSNIDEFTTITAEGLCRVGGANHGKAIIVLNPADPPVTMRNTVFCQLPDDTDTARVTNEIESAVAHVRSYVPGYRLVGQPQFLPGHVAIAVDVQGAGDFFPGYAGNLDIMTSAAVAVGEQLAQHVSAGSATS